MVVSVSKEISVMLCWYIHIHVQQYLYHDNERVDRYLLVVQLLRHHQNAALGVQMEELGALWVEAAVDGVHQLTVGVSILGTELQDVLPGRRILWNPNLNKR